MQTQRRPRLRVPQPHDRPYRLVSDGAASCRPCVVDSSVGFQTGFCMRNFIKQLPDALLNAARKEASELGISCIP
jgi:hypothetical protein